MDNTKQNEFNPLIAALGGQGQQGDWSENLKWWGRYLGAQIPMSIPYEAKNLFLEGLPKMLGVNLAARMAPGETNYDPMTALNLAGSGIVGGAPGMPKRIPGTVDVGVVNLPEGFYHNILKQLDQAMSGQLGKQQLGAAPRGGQLFSALQKQQVSGEELGLPAVQKLRGSPEQTSVEQVLAAVGEQVPGLEKKVLGNKFISRPEYEEFSRLEFKRDFGGGISQDEEHRLSMLADLVNKAQGSPKTKWEQYSVPGYEPGTYRENLWYYDPAKQATEGSASITSRPIVINSFQDLVARSEGVSAYDARDLSDPARDVYDLIRIGQYERAAELANKQVYDEVAGLLNTRSSPAYQEKDIHFGNELGRNLLAWSRTNERKLASGERVVMAEELQSGWHSKGSKEGYKVQAGEGFGVPDAPLKTDWYKPLMRDLVRDAVTKGLDGVAWTPSDIQVKRWPNPDRAEMEKAKAFYERLYDKEIVKFMKSEYGVEPVRKKTSTSDLKDNLTDMYLEDVWYIPLTPAVRQRVALEGQKLSKNEQGREQTSFA
jgi:hypothetical protein